MSDKPIYASSGVIVTPQMATINGQTYAIGQIARVGYLTQRGWWRGVFLWGAALLASVGLIALLLASCGTCQGKTGWEIVAIVYGYIAGFFGLIMAASGGIPLLIAKINNRTGNYLEISTSDGREHQIRGLAPEVAHQVKAAVERALAMR